MNAREKAALKNRDIKLFVMPQELALVVSCLNWVQADLMRAANNLKNTESDAEKDLPNVFTPFIPLIEMTRTSILLHGRTHYEEKHDEKGCQLMLDTINKLDKETTELQSFTRIINRTKA
jgi:hypothetical protein